MLQHRKSISSASEQTVGNLLKEANLKRKMDEECKRNEERHKEVMERNEVLYKQMIAQNQLIKRLGAQCLTDSVDYKILPFRSIEEIEDVEETLYKYPKEELLEYLKTHLGRVEIFKSIPILFTEKLLLEVNWDGKKQKKALNKIKFFHTYVFEAIKKKNMTFPEFENEMRKGFKIAKNKVYKNASRKKEKLEETIE
ncbi:uncharacterized protein [Eurosta solidaginis]|uniref:uncharacterized protein isoform X2 n=1 Tax=Eurosta solidaginis TaxID=178769 RepID=UPI0035309836